MLTILNIQRFFVLLSVFTHSIIGEEPRITEYKDRIILEDFETIKLVDSFIKVQANNHYLPEIRVSKNLTSPDLQSNTSLLIRIPDDSTGIPIDLLFTKPYKLEDYIIEFEFYIYSNRANGDLFLYLQDAKFENHKIRIANLNFDGWKSFKIPIGNLVTQSNFIISKPSFMKLTGIHFNLSRKETRNKEDIIAIDDIYIVKRQRQMLPKHGLTAFH